MRNQQGAKERFLDELNTFEEKIQEMRSLTEKNGISVEDLAKRGKKVGINFRNKMEAVEKMASKKQ